MSADEIHTPTNAGPAPTETIAPSASSWEQPAGTAVPSAASQSNPAPLVGAAFAGGLVAALILKRLGRD
jgi:hypothetical protein